MVEFCVPPAVTVTDRANLTDPVWDNAERFPDAVQFVRTTDRGRIEVGCRQFRDEVVAVARGLVAAGVRPGMRIGLLSRTRYEWTLVDYAIWAAGAISVPMYETSSPEQVRWMLSDADTTACVVETDAHARMLAGIRDGVPGLREVWQVDAGDLDELTARGDRVDPGELDARRAAVNAGDLATIIYTSGTTGRPKGCMLTHRNLSFDVANAVAALPDIFHEGASTVLFLPLAHAFARLIQLGAVQTRTRLAHSAGMENLTGELQQLRPTFLLCVPRVFEKVYQGAASKARADGKNWVFTRADRLAVHYSQALQDPSGPGPLLRLRHRVFDRLVYRKLRAALGGRCRLAISGGAPLEARLTHFFRGAGVTVLEGYGLTETSPAVTSNLPDAIRIGTVGRPLPGVTVRVADDGEVLVKGDLVFQGYWNNADATEEALTADGWLHSGDLGELAADGYLSITGRKKDIIVTAAGKHVVPGVLEERVRSHALVDQCVVVGDRRPFVGALVTIDQQEWPNWLAAHQRDSTTSVAQLRDDPALRADIQTAVDEANRQVSHPEAIKQFRILPVNLTEANAELTPTLKVKREAVQEKYHADIAAMYGS